MPSALTAVLEVELHDSTFELTANGLTAANASSSLEPAPSRGKKPNTVGRLSSFPRMMRPAPAGFVMGWGHSVGDAPANANVEHVAAAAAARTSPERVDGPSLYL